ncbi:MAG: hypothetical protein IPP78_08710 [Holophagaceae bacterium]|nr:hypothetical protein [Holophagaceae bacterium]
MPPRLRLLLLSAVLSSVLSAMGALESHTPYHSASDVVATPDSAVLLTAWFHNCTAAQKCLEHVPVRAEWLLDGLWTPIGETTTDGEGKAVLAVKAPLKPGTVKLRWWYKQQPAEATLFVIRPGQTASVFDIDGTLTVSDAENWKDYGRRLRHDPRPGGPKLRANAVAAVNGAAGDSLVVYLTGRPPWLGRPTRQWLNYHQFPDGPVLWMPFTRDILPTQKRVGEAKLAQLKSLQNLGLTFIRAFGNASTDIHAYERAGIPKSRTFIMGKHGGEGGTVRGGTAYPVKDKLD